MYMCKSSAQPLISICIPTYNRANSIETLFASLKVIKDVHADDVEICISNNCSSDHTDETIKRWQHLLDLKIVVQIENIGGTLNAIEVTKLATGRWVQIVGDDDAFNPAQFHLLLDLLRIENSKNWVLVGVSGSTEQEALFARLGHEKYATESLRQLIAQTGLGCYGFIGMHIIPSSWLPQYHSLSLSNARGWPHLALFVRYLLERNQVSVCRSIIVEQAAGASVLFWKIDDWVRVSLARVDIVNDIKKLSSPSKAIFLKRIALKEIYAPANIKNMILWKALEEKNFNLHAIHEYFSRYKMDGLLAILFIPHGLLIILLRFISARLLNFALRRLGYENIIDDYAMRKATMAGFDGLKRGL